MGRETCAAGVRGAETSEFTRCFHIGMLDTYPSPSRSGSDSGGETRESPEILSKFKYCVNASSLMLACLCCVCVCVCVCTHEQCLSVC